MSTSTQEKSDMGFVLQEYETIESWVEDLADEFDESQDIWTQVEAANPDFSFHGDANLESLIEGLQYNGLEMKEIIQMSKNRYGNVIDFYKIDNFGDPLYVIGIGAR